MPGRRRLPCVHQVTTVVSRHTRYTLARPSRHTPPGKHCFLSHQVYPRPSRYTPPGDHCVFASHQVLHPRHRYTLPDNHCGFLTPGLLHQVTTVVSRHTRYTPGTDICPSYQVTTHTYTTPDHTPGKLAAQI